jgi:hypothetical protein
MVGGQRRAIDARQHLWGHGVSRKRDHFRQRRFRRAGRWVVVPRQRSSQRRSVASLSRRHRARPARRAFQRIPAGRRAGDTCALGGLDRQLDDAPERLTGMEPDRELPEIVFVGLDRAQRLRLCPGSVVRRIGAFGQMTGTLRLKPASPSRPPVDWRRVRPGASSFAPTQSQRGWERLASVRFCLLLIYP